jgi:anti-anti-sigma factor
MNVTAAADGAMRVQISGELDLSTSPQLGEALAGGLTAGRSVVVDLSGVTFIDSTAIRALVDAWRLCESNGGRLAVSHPLPTQVSRVFQVTGLDAVLPIVHE